MTHKDIIAKVKEQIGYKRDALGQVTCPSCGAVIIDGTPEQAFTMLTVHDALKINEHGEFCKDFLRDIGDS